MKIHSLKDRMEKERELNKRIMKESEGSMVSYGAEVQFMHKDSGYFLTRVNECALTKRIGYGCELSSWHNSGMLFKILPKFKSREIGELIQINDTVMIQNVKSEFYLNFDEGVIPAYQDHHCYNSNSVDETIFRVKKIITDPSFQRRTMFLSEENECAWKLKIHTKATQKNGSAVLGTHFVRLKHTETKGLLGALIPHESSEIAEVYCQNYQGKLINELNSLDTIWEIQHIENPHTGDSFECRHQTNSLGEDSKISPKIRFRHFLTGRYFSNVDYNHSLRIGALSGNYYDIEQKGYTVFEFEPLLKGFEELLYGYSYYVKCTGSETDEYSFYLRSSLTKLNGDEIHRLYQNEPSNQNSGFSPIQNDAKYFLKRQVVMKKEFSTEDAFSILSIGQTFTEEILFVRSCILKMNNVLHKIRGEGRQAASEDYSKIVKIIQQIICFIVDIEFSNEIDFTNLAAEANKEKQMIIKNMGLIDILIDISMIPLKLEINQESQGSLMGAISFSYTGVKFIIQNYKPNELYASQWLRIIMTKSVEIEEKYQINTNSMLTELLDNNRRILESKIDDNLISNFLQDILKTGKKHPKYLVTLTVLCICNGEPIRKNQKVLCNLFLSNLEVMNKLNVRIFEKSGEITYFDDNDKDFKSITQLGNKGEGGIPDSFRNYFLQLIRLYSVICFERNVIGINILQKHFPYELCCKVVMNEKIHTEVRAVFINLIKDLWINVEPYSRIMLPKQIVLWEEYQIPVFPTSNRDFSMHSKLVSYVITQLEIIKSENIRSNIKQLKFLQQLLLITKYLYMKLGSLSCWDS